MDWSPYYAGAITDKRRLILASLLTLSLSFAVQVTTLPYLALATENTTDVAQQETAVEGETADAHLARTTEEKPPLYGPEAEAYVREYYKDTPILAEIARCESSFRQEDPRTGAVLRGMVNSADLGMMQINAFYHGDTAKRLGHDLHTLDGNLAYARYLYEREGTQPWSASRACWESHAHLAMR